MNEDKIKCQLNTWKYEINKLLEGDLSNYSLGLNKGRMEIIEQLLEFIEDGSFD